MIYSSFRTRCASRLQDSTVSGQASSNSIYPTAELDLAITEGLHELAKYAKHLVLVPYTIESRTGTATSTTASHLVDATEAQFLSTDTGKVVYNTADKTWALITAYTSASDVTLSKDIMASGEGYEIYNIGCQNSKQINISDPTDILWVDSVEYPVGTSVNFYDDKGNPRILTLDTWVEGSKVVTSGDQPNTTVHVYFNKRHKLSQLTDFAGAVNYSAGYAAGSTSMVVASLGTTETIEADQEFTVANMRGVYTVTTAVTLSGGGGTISFYPGLQSAVANAAVLTFTQTTLTPELEDMLFDIVVTRSLYSKLLSFIPTVNVGSADTATKFMAIADREQMRLQQRLNALVRTKSATKY